MESFKETTNKPIIIAEAGVNHNGSLENAFKLVDIAVEAGVNYVKFQTFRSEKLVSVSAKTANYQKLNCMADSQLEMLKKLELQFEDFSKLKAYCLEKGIGFLSTPFDSESLEFLVELGIDFIKVPSGEITDYPLLQEIAKTKLPVVISTGMSYLHEIKEAVELFLNKGYEREMIRLLHCNTQYPTPYADVNLLAMKEMEKIFGIRTGYSDHTQGIEVSLAAAALGACIIEKHFTIDRNMDGPDHKASLEPQELKELVKSIRNINLALGSTLKTVTDSEKENLNAARKSIVALREIKTGDFFSEKNLTVRRPGFGLSPMKWKEIIGKKASRDIKEGDLIEPSDLIVSL